MRFDRRRLEERVFRVLMIAATFIVVGTLFAVFAVVILRGAQALNLEMITQTPRGGYYLGGSGGILNAILGSLYLGVGATIAALIIALPVALFLQREYVGRTRFAAITRLSLDILWGVPSIVYGAFGFIVMIYLGLRASLLGGIIVLTLLELPIMIRALDEVVRRVPQELKEASYALGATKLETTTRVVIRQIVPGAVTGVLLAFGRGIGDAASILFTAGYTDTVPHSLFDPVASLPLAVFFQLGSPIPEVQQRAYASAVILLILVLIITVVSRLIAMKFTKYVIK